MLRTLGKFIFSGGYDSSSAKLEAAASVMSDGSENVLITGAGKTLVFKGITVKGGVDGSRVLMNTGDTYGGLGTTLQTAIGSVIRVLGSIFFIGTGRLFYAGADTGETATPTLSLKKITGGSLGTTYQAGLAQPSAPTIQAITPPTGMTGKNNGVVSAKIARVRSATGARSIASLASNVAQATNQSIAVTVPSADANGQDYWEFDFTKNGEGGIGNHFFHSEIAESVIAASVTANATTDADTTIGVPNGTLTSANIGWAYASAGDTSTYVTAVGAADSHSAGKQTITLNAASVLTATQSATFTRAVAGLVRTYVFEWRDADLAGADLAPTRDYPPPAGLFCGVAEDVVFVDGCYGDTTNVLTRTTALDSGYAASNVGNAIAVSEPNKPESFSPDAYIFTGDSPTCILQGGQGVYWRFAQNSMGIIRYVGGSPAISYEKLWNGVGIRNQNNATLGMGGRLYAYTGARGAVRLGIGGEPDTLFAAKVSDDMAGWTAANVVLGNDANHQYVFYAHGQTILAFYEPLSVWCAPLDAAATLGAKTICAMVTINGAVYIAAKDGSEIKLYDFNIGSGTTAAVTTAWMDSPMEADIIARIRATVRTDNLSAIAVKTFTNGNYTTAKATQTVTPTVTGLQTLPTLRPNVRGARLSRFELTLTSSGGDAGFEGLTVEGESSGVVV